MRKPLLSLALLSSACWYPVFEQGLSSQPPPPGYGHSPDGGAFDAGLDAGVDGGSTGSADGGPVLYGIARPSCAPNDGPAWDFTLSEGPLSCEVNQAEGFFVSLWIGELTPGSYRLDETPTSSGTACLCGVLGDVVRTGVVAIDAASDAGVSGRIDAVFSSGQERHDAFQAVLCPGTRQCG